MLKQNRLMAWTMVGALAMGGGIGSAIAQDANTPAREGQTTAVEEAEIKTITGQIVDLHSYLRTEKAKASDRDEGLLQALTAEMPIALVAEPEGVVDRILPGQRMYLVIFNPNVDESKSAYKEARSLVGTRVAITGETFDRHGLHAISVLGIVEPAPEDGATQASAAVE